MKNAEVVVVSGDATLCIACGKRIPVGSQALKYPEEVYDTIRDTTTIGDTYICERCIQHAFSLIELWGNDGK